MGEVGQPVRGLSHLDMTSESLRAGMPEHNVCIQREIREQQVHVSSAVLLPPTPMSDPRGKFHCPSLTAVPPTLFCPPFLGLDCFCLEKNWGIEWGQAYYNRAPSKMIIKG